MAYKYEAFKSILLSESTIGTSPHFLYRGHIIKPGNRRMLTDLLNADLLIDILPEEVAPNLCQVMETSEVTVLETTFKIGSIILQELLEDNLPKFGKVKNIIVFRRNIYLTFETFKTEAKHGEWRVSCSAHK